MVMVSGRLLTTATDSTANRLYMSSGSLPTPRYSGWSCPVDYITAAGVHNTWLAVYTGGNFFLIPQGGTSAVGFTGTVNSGDEFHFDFLCPI